MTTIPMQMAIPINENDQIEKSRSGGLYFDMQLGADINIQNDLNVTPYVDFGAVHEFTDASPSIMLGLGIMGLVKADDNLSYIGGLEFHSSDFAFRKVEAYHGYNIDTKSTLIMYTGGGTTLSGGILYNLCTVKLLYITNSYKLQDIDTGDEFSNRFLTSQFPTEVSTQSIGVSVGLKF